MNMDKDDYNQLRPSLFVHYKEYVADKSYIETKTIGTFFKQSD